MASLVGGASATLLVWMDHQNLEYIHSAKRLSSRQARWALLFDRFDFTLLGPQMLSLMLMSLAAIRQQFWWPSIGQDVRQIVLACSVCAQNKVSNHPVDQWRIGLLQLLPIPSRPWSHIALDLVSGLPPSRGYTVILTVVDRFTKAVHFVPLPKLPSAKETAQLVIVHIFRIHGLPVDVVSDRGPQFVLRFWQEFCRQIGASTSLSSGFHTQTNGQCE